MKIISRLTIMVVAVTFLRHEVTAQTVDLGTADSFAVLAGSGITNTGSTTVTGDIGTYPTTSITDGGNLTVIGTNYGGNAVTQQAKIDLVTAYNDAAGRTINFVAPSDLGGLTLVAGVYNNATSLAITGVLTLDAGGNADAVWVFQAGSTLVTAANNSMVILINGAQACHVFWQVGSSATLGTNTSFQGNILASESISATTGATVLGRLLALNGAVTLDTNTIVRAICAQLTDGTTTPGGEDDDDGPTTTATATAAELEKALILAGQLVDIATLPGLTSIYTQGFAQFDTEVFSVQQRFADLRAGSRTARAPSTHRPGPSTIPSGKNPVGGKNPWGGKDAWGGKGVQPEEVQLAEDDRWGFFIIGTGDYVTAGDANSYDGTTIGTSLGIDYRVSEQFVVGLSIGYSHSDSDLLDDGKVKADGGKAALYAMYQNGGFYTEGLVGGGYNSYDIERSAFLSPARGDTNGGQFDAYLGFGYDVKIGNWTITPMVSLLYTMVGIDGFNEVGSLLPLIIESQHASSLRVRVGPRVAYTAQVGSAMVTPSFSAQWQHEFLDDELPFEARFANDAGNLFTVYGPKVGRDSLLLSAALNVAWSRYAAYIAYQADLGRKNYESHTGLVGFRASW